MATIFKLIRVTEDSMLPTYTDGNILLVRTSAKKITRNDVILFTDPIGLKKMFIKRVIGLPGELIQILNTGVILINEKTFNSEFNTYSSGVEEIQSEWKLKLDEYVVLGDNRIESIDSRRYGAIKKNLILGKVIKRILK